MHIVPCCGPGSANPNLKPPGTSIALPGIEPEDFTKNVFGNSQDGMTDGKGEATSTQLQDDRSGNGMGNEPISGVPPVSGELAGDQPPPLIPPRVNSGETRKMYWERLRKFARAAGLPKGQGPGTAYEWATITADPIYDVFRAEQEAEKAKLAEAQTTVEPTPTAGTESLESQENEQIDPEICEPLVHKTPEMEVAPKEQPADLGVAGLGEIPESWPELPANAQLQIEIAWVTANRLKVRSGKGVDLSRALSPAPSYSALSWLETSILFPAKFADISVKATAQTDDEKEDIRREKLAIDEIRSILKEMLEAKKD